jgi:hypothetical protein
MTWYDPKFSLVAVFWSSLSHSSGNFRFMEHNLSIPVPITWVPLATTADDGVEFPVIKISDMVRHLASLGSLNKLFGCEPEDGIQNTLLDFWNRFSKEVPDHQVFSANLRGEISLQRAIPYMVHGDEGRCFKKKGIMLVTVQGVIGKGTRPFVERFAEHAKDRKRRMGVNIGGHSFDSRILFAAMQRKFYASNPDTRSYSQ